MATRNIKGQNYNITITDNSSLIKEELKKRKEKITYAIGLKWQKIATELVTVKRIVDTGRLRGSLTFITSAKAGRSINKVKIF